MTGLPGRGAAPSPLVLRVADVADHDRGAAGEIKRGGIRAASLQDEAQAWPRRAAPVSAKPASMKAECRSFASGSASVRPKATTQGSCRALTSAIENSGAWLKRALYEACIQ